MSQRTIRKGTTGITGTWRPWPGSQAQTPSSSTRTSVRCDRPTPEAHIVFVITWFYLRLCPHTCLPPTGFTLAGAGEWEVWQGPRKAARGWSRACTALSCWPVCCGGPMAGGSDHGRCAHGLCREHSPRGTRWRADPSHSEERAPAVHRHLVSPGLPLGLGLSPAHADRLSPPPEVRTLCRDSLPVV